jgi:hypothetical protein
MSGEPNTSPKRTKFQGWCLPTTRKDEAESTCLHLPGVIYCHGVTLLAAGPTVHSPKVRRLGGKVVPLHSCVLAAHNRLATHFTQHGTVALVAELVWKGRKLHTAWRTPITVITACVPPFSMKRVPFQNSN